MRLSGMSPVGVLCAIERGRCGAGMHIKNITSAPARRVGVVLNGPQAPFRAPCHGVDRNAPEESLLLAGRAAVLNPFDECFEIGRVAFAADFDADQVEVSRIFIVVDSIAHFAQIPAKLGFFGADDGELQHRKRGRGKNEQNAGRNKQLKKGETGFFCEGSLARSHFCTVHPRQTRGTRPVYIRGFQPQEKVTKAHRRRQCGNL